MGDDRWFSLTAVRSPALRPAHHDVPPKRHLITPVPGECHSTGSASSPGCPTVGGGAGWSGYGSDVGEEERSWDAWVQGVPGERASGVPGCWEALE